MSRSDRSIQRMDEPSRAASEPLAERSAGFMADSPAMAAQRRALHSAFGTAAQRMAPEEELQKKAAPGAVQRMGPEEELQKKAIPGTVQRMAPEEELQKKAAPRTVQRMAPEDELQKKAMPGTVQRMAPEEELQKKAAPGAVQRQTVQRAEEPNRTGMPDHLKSGIEQLSGMDMSDVRVHTNSAEPRQLNALAYAQGNDIHLGPGQEQHMAHEAWHVVQQRQGRVQATTDVGGVAVNDNPGLEHEADVMGGHAGTVQAKADEDLEG